MIAVRGSRCRQQQRAARWVSRPCGSPSEAAIVTRLAFQSRRDHLLTKMLRWCGIVLAAASVVEPVIAAHDADGIVVDGRLDEPQWRAAEVFGGFRVTQPYTLTEPSYPTEVRLLSTPAGLAFGFIVTQPASVERQRERTPRDADAPGDRVNVYIDFDADAEVAYVLTVALSGSMQDATLTDENRYSSDWDGDWQAAVAEQDDTWTVEYLVPWTMASMRASAAARRTIAVQFDRVLGVRQERSAFPGASFERPRFVSEFHRVDVAQYRAALLYAFPYVTALRDLVADRSELKAGLDLFWKPAGDWQLTAALQPDFGQVEADELVVNFDAVETFFSDKRPFFTENQALFDLRTPDEGQLVYTRRIGGPRDDAPQRVAEIDAALKLTGSTHGFNWGALAALESDFADDLGRLFVLQRVQRPGQILALGWLGSWTERPFLDRSAIVNAVDATWRPGPTVLLAAQAIASAVDEPSGDRNGRGAWLRLDWTPSARLRHQLEATHFDAALDFNDLGFQRRASLNELRWTSVLQQSGFPPGHRLRGIEWSGELQYRSNDRGDRLPLVLIPELRLQHASGAGTLFSLLVESSGYDDLISRGNGLLRREPETSFLLEHETARIGDFQFDAFVNPFRTSIGDDGFSVGGGASWLPRQDFNLELDLEWLVTDAWLVWQRDRLFGAFDRRRVTAELDANWFPADAHELRLKLQWLAIDAATPRAFDLGPDARLRPSAVALDAFSINNFGLQLRYRWTFAPQSDLYVVYSRGGFSAATGDPRGVGELFQDAFSLRDADQFLVKLRYRY